MAKQNSVIIDPGHGGSDPGALYGNRREKDDTLALSYDIGNALEQRGIRVEYTRIGDVYNSPYEKAEIGNRSAADLFLSIHRNAGTRRFRRFSWRLDSSIMRTTMISSMQI